MYLTGGLIPITKFSCYVIYLVYITLIRLHHRAMMNEC